MDQKLGSNTYISSLSLILMYEYLIQIFFIFLFWFYPS